MSKFLSILLRLPMWILVLASCGAAYYAVYAQLIEGLTWAVPGIYTAVIVLYILGLFLKDKATDEENSSIDVGSSIYTNELAEETEAVQTIVEANKQ